MGKHAVDSSTDHLYEPFRTKLAEVLAKAPGGPWRLIEGYRSVERQLWLYAQGRTRPGKIVTWMRTPKNHGAGLAADVIPKAGYDAPQATWVGLRTVYHAEGLENPAWSKGDFGHVQWDASDTAMHAKATAWIRNGFHEAPAGTTEIPVHVGGILIPDADGVKIDGKVYVALRPVAEALGYVIASVANGKAQVVDDDGEATVPVIIRSGRGFAWSRDFGALANVTWDPTAGLAFTDK